MKNSKRSGVAIPDAKEGRAKARPYIATTPTMKKEDDGSTSSGSTSRLDAEYLWKQIEDVLVPHLRLSVIDHVAYSHLVRHSRLEGKRRLRFSILWLARNIRLSGGRAQQGRSRG